MWLNLLLLENIINVSQFTLESILFQQLNEKLFVVNKIHAPINSTEDKEYDESLEDLNRKLESLKG